MKSAASTRFGHWSRHLPCSMAVKRREHCLDPQKKSERVQPRMRFHSVAIVPSHTPAVACNNQTYDCMRPLSLENTFRARLPEKLQVASWESEAMVVCCERW